jgi:hypothetical protein
MHDGPLIEDTWNAAALRRASPRAQFVMGSPCMEGNVVGCRINFSGRDNFGVPKAVSLTWTRNGAELGTVRFDARHQGRFHPAMHFVVAMCDRSGTAMVSDGAALVAEQPGGAAVPRQRLFAARAAEGAVAPEMPPTSPMRSPMSPPYSIHRGWLVDLGSNMSGEGAALCTPPPRCADGSGASAPPDTEGDARAASQTFVAKGQVRLASRKGQVHLVPRGAGAPASEGAAADSSAAPASVELGAGSGALELPEPLQLRGGGDLAATFTLAQWSPPAGEAAGAGADAALGGITLGLDLDCGGAAGGAAGAAGRHLAVSFASPCAHFAAGSVRVLDGETLLGAPVSPPPPSY